MKTLFAICSTWFWCSIALSAGNLTDGPDADIYVDPVSGWVVLDANDTESGSFLSFVIATENGHFRDYNFMPSFGVEPNTVLSEFQISQSNPLNQGIGSRLELGFIAPTGMDLAVLADFFSEVSYQSDVGIVRNFDLIVGHPPCGFSDQDADVDSADRTKQFVSWTGDLSEPGSWFGR